MYKIIVFVTCIVIICYGCNYSNPDKNVSLTSYSDTDSNGVVKFAYDDASVGKVLSLDFLNDTIFVISTTNPVGVFAYNLSGKKMHQTTLKGRGPGEFLAPSIVRTYNDTLFIWCSKNLKLLMYNKNLSYIGEISNLEPKAINDFIVHKDLICFYHKGGWDNVISIFDRNTAEYVYTGGLGSEEHKVLQTNSIAGGMIIKDNSLYFAYADQLSLFKLSLDSFNIEEKISISDNEFIVSELTINADDLINTKRGMLVDYLMTNSCVKGVYLNNNRIIIKSEVGFYKQKKLSKNVDYSNRYFKYYVVNADNQIKIKKKQIERNLDLEYYPIYTGHNDKFFSITAHLDNNSFYYQLNQLNLKLE